MFHRFFSHVSKFSLIRKMLVVVVAVVVFVVVVVVVIFVIVVVVDVKLSPINITF